MKGKTYMTEDWRPTIGCIEKARQKYPRYDLEHYIEECRDHWLGNGKPMKCWDAVFRNWLRRAGQFGNVVTRKTHAEQGRAEGDNVLAFSVRQAKAKGINITGMTETQIQDAIFYHDHPQAKR